jgi:hypothetical protein
MPSIIFMPHSPPNCRGANAMENVGGKIFFINLKLKLKTIHRLAMSQAVGVTNPMNAPNSQFWPAKMAHILLLNKFISQFRLLKNISSHFGKIFSKK